MSKIINIEPITLNNRCAKRTELTFESSCSNETPILYNQWNATSIHEAMNLTYVTNYEELYLLHKLFLVI